MKLKTLGKSTLGVDPITPKSLGVEVQNIDLHGLWLFAKGKEYFLPYNDYPWFKNAKITDVLNVQLLHKFHLYWPSLDVDLDLNTIEDTNVPPFIYQ